MARGFDSVKEAGRDIEERKNALGDGDFTPRVYFKIAPGKSATVRFLEQGEEVNWAWVHEIPVEGRGLWHKSSMPRSGRGRPQNWRVLPWL
jgi:hypothetical protein